MTVQLVELILVNEIRGIGNYLIGIAQDLLSEVILLFILHDPNFKFVIIFTFNVDFPFCLPTRPAQYQKNCFVREVALKS